MDRPESKRWPEDTVNEFIDQVSTAGADYRRLVELLPAIVYACEIGEHGRWRYVSPQIEEILGFTAEEWTADPDLWARQIHPEDRERTLAQEAADADRSNGGAARPIDYRLISKGGEIVWILDIAVLQPDEGGTPIWHGVLYDITERKTAEEDLRRALDQQATVARLSSRALQQGESETLMREAVSLMLTVEGIHSATIWEADRDGRRLQVIAGAEVQAGGSDRRPTAARSSHAGAALESGLHVIVDDWESERRYAMPPVLRVAGLRSSLAVPIAGKDRPFGVLDLHSRLPNHFTPQDVHFAQASANVLADAVERHAADRALRHRVLHDSLTGLPNRTSFVGSLEAALGRGASDGTPVGVLFMDLDSFKVINDSSGHHAGDELLREVAPRLRSHLRPGDVVARFGGDEFGILIDRLADEDEAIAIANRVADAFSEPFLVEGSEYYLSSSIGIAVARPSRSKPVEAEDLIRDADAAMYRAKERGRARYELYDAEMRARAARRLEVERELREAIGAEQLEVYYQPVVALAGGEIIGFEGLVRWRHPQRGLLDPGEFLSIAEQCGLIEPIGRWVQEAACRRAVEWQALRPDRRPLEVSVNLSSRQVASRTLVDSVSEVLDATGLEPSLLRLEVVENALVEDAESASETLEALSRLGVRLVLDDFGTGYSSLAYLNRFPFQALKIDRSFVRGLGVEQEHSAIVEAIVGMARALSLDAVAEGVENEAQLSELRRLGCDFAQGHLFSRPLPADSITELVEEGSLDLLGNAAR